MSNPSDKSGPALGSILGRLIPGKWCTPALVVLILLGGYVLPRVVALGGVTMTNQLYFMDMPVHLTNMTLLDRISGLQLGSDPYLSRFPEMAQLDFATRWPTGLYELAAPMARAFGPLSIWTTQLVNLLFTVVLVLAVVLLGRKLGGTRTGLWGAVLVVLCPALATSAWYFSLDYPLVAMVTMGLYLLWRTRGFCSLPDSISLGAWSALGLWIKYNYVLYLLVPSLVVLALGLRRGPRRGRLLLHLAAAVGVTFLLTWLLARPDITALWKELTLHATAVTSVGFTQKLLTPWSLPWLTSMFWLTAASFPWPLLVLALPGLVLAHRANVRRELALLLAFLWGNGVILTLMANKMERYIQPLYPVLCLLTAWGLARLVPRRWRVRALAGVAAAYGVVLGATLLYPLPWVLDIPAAEEVTYMWEFRTPDRHRLRELRRKTYHPTCDFRPLAKQVAALVGKSAPDQVLGVGAFWRRPPARDFLEPSELGYFTYLAAAQADRTRLLVPLVNMHINLPEHVLQMPQFLLLHHPSMGYAKEYPGIQIPERRTIILRCGDKREELWLTLARGRK